MPPCCPPPGLQSSDLQHYKRASWHYASSWPSHLLNRARMYQGDDTRLQMFVKKMVQGAYMLGSTAVTTCACCNIPCTHTRPHAHPHTLHPMATPAGTPVKIAWLGGSVSLRGYQVPHPDTSWVYSFHKWLEMTFTPCAELLPPGTSHLDPSETYRTTGHVCPASNIEMHNLAVYASGPCYQESCVLAVRAGRRAQGRPARV